MSNITMVELNAPPVADDPVAPSVPDPIPAAVEEPAPVDVEAAADIDTEELEGLLSDLKKTKKLNKAAPKKRTRKPKDAVTEAPPVVEPVVVAPVEVEPVVVPPKPKRKYTKKPDTTPAVVEEPPQPSAPSPVPEEPVLRSPGNMIEEMQRAERALRYQMRKNKMQTLVTQAF